MPYPTTLSEFRTRWLPHASDTGLTRLVELLQHASPFLVHGAFERCAPTGCLATHLAWHHPVTADLTEDAGVTWLSRVAGLNPATSCVVQEWDRSGIHDWSLRSELLRLCREEVDRRADEPIEDDLPAVVCSC
ncbi:MAG TPA: hypothetical protein VGJ05_20735 [Fimbriiglobus sp.]|jgi:hypothetical protein